MRALLRDLFAHAAAARLGIEQLLLDAGDILPVVVALCLQNSAVGFAPLTVCFHLGDRLALLLELQRLLVEL